MYILVYYYLSVVLEICLLCMYNSFIIIEYYIGECERLKKGAIYIYDYIFYEVYKR